MPASKTTTFVLLGLGLAHAYDLPANLRTIYDSHKTAKCSNVAASRFSDGQTSGTSFSYCLDIEGAIFLHSSASGGQYADMDIDCDGQNPKGGACSDDPTGQPQTSFDGTGPISDIPGLDAKIHPYVVFGNEGDDPSFTPAQIKKLGMQPLSVMAVVCNNQVWYGVWGDTNGGTDVGESSISLAQMCYPDEHLTGNKGHTKHDVLYIGFRSGSKAVSTNANWKAKNVKDFEASIKSLGDSLVKSLKA